MIACTVQAKIDVAKAVGVPTCGPALRGQCRYSVEPSPKSIEIEIAAAIGAERP